MAHCVNVVVSMSVNKALLADGAQKNDVSAVLGVACSVMTLDAPC
jgi:hypothetical protein